MRNFNISIIALLESHHKSRRNILQILSSAIVSSHFSGDPFVSSKLLLHSHSDADDDDDDEATFAFSKALFLSHTEPKYLRLEFHIQGLFSELFTSRIALSYNLMRRRDSPLFPDSYSFPFLLKACGHCSHCQIDSICKTVYGINKVIRFETLDFDILNCQQYGKLSTENPHGMQVSLVENGIMITPVETMVQLWSKALELKGIAKFGYGLGL
ncbi:hypothetical protein FEM48_Zijuj05G0091700 [Ziziphus jujuba var. spinosa]|uniref:Uncharacterized protein n=1 Tax=Ziziphus jujuba var. spinosa TaxID=714518 RepID=A0A978VE33_ZIZJJ|nr:hypothetical protein FEM48_Zijuj05G0091700 [Ziziphus jujuba var. spinosa]